MCVWAREVDEIHTLHLTVFSQPTPSQWKVGEVREELDNYVPIPKS